MRKKKVKFHIRKDDIVEVIAGNEKKKRGKVLALDTRKQRATVEGVNKRIFHIKPTQKDAKGRREQREASIHISKLMLVDAATQQRTRTGRRPNADNKLQRYSKKTNNFIQ